MRKKGEVDLVDQYQESLPPAERLAVQQYRQLVAAAQELWRVIYDRTDYKEWRDGNYADVGSCFVTEAVADAGVFLQSIHAMRQQRNLAVPGQPGHYDYRRYSDSEPQRRPACSYHRTGQGCVLDDLKSPTCVCHINAELYAEIERKYGTFTAGWLFQVMSELSMALHTIQRIKEFSFQERRLSFQQVLADITQLQAHFERIR